ncbi:uncharacterized protein LOC129746038 [Uranotaenia lowii]|uniref:uncharacterized protein LOC129746038 n=1 Tax=Uranotaenia lowii TaxID=190385 RepID=UPI0024798AD1|nr:uncharacterized protein LOC129746038 [Uranotaenia lowii]XP_055595436.1 uncharacterized protein LOC129746038 [Uranotaenia lowii]
MDIIDLNDEEIDYELQLRNKFDLGFSNRRTKLSALRSLITEEKKANTFAKSSDHVMNIEDNLNICLTNLEAMKLNTRKAVIDNDSNSKKQLLSRLEHYRNRLDLIPKDQPRSELLVQLTSEVKQLHTTLTSNEDTGGVDNTQLEAAANLTISDSMPRTSSPFRGFGEEDLRNDRSTRGATVPSTDPVNLSRRMETMQRTGAIPKSNTNADARRDIDSNKRNQTELLEEILERLRQLPIAQPQQVIQNHQTLHQNTYAALQQVEMHQAPPLPDRGNSQRHRGLHRENQNNEMSQELRDEALLSILREQNRHQRGPRGKPIHAWPFKYDGKGSPLDLIIFIKKVEKFAMTDDMNGDELMSQIKFLLVGKALDWFCLSCNAYISWDEFKTKIKQQFIPRDFAQLIRKQVYCRVQKPNESFETFNWEMTLMFGAADPPFSEMDQFHIIRTNLNQHFRLVTIAAQVSSLASLIKVCEEVDEANINSGSFAANSNRPQELGRANVYRQLRPQMQRDNRPTVQHGINAIESENTQQWNSSLMQHNMLDSSQQYDSNIPLDPSIHNYQSTRERQTEVSEFGNELNGAGCNAVQVDNKGQNFRMMNRPTPINPTTTLRCWQCGRDDHFFLTCPFPKTHLFCYRCGKQGYTVRNCTDCIQMARDLMQSHPGNARGGNC